jgi:ABC-type multidrug transport system fused ATPase/permease subunit
MSLSLIIMDEASSSIDLETDELIQRTLHEELAVRSSLPSLDRQTCS